MFHQGERELQERAGVRGAADRLNVDQQKWIRQADTFFIGTNHPVSGADASHRAGPPGFVEVPDARHLVIPDYAGNNMFNTLGNIAVNPAVGLLFWDVPTGRTLQITGTGRVDHEPPPESEVLRRLLVEISGVVECAGGTRIAP